MSVKVILKFILAARAFLQFQQGEATLQFLCVVSHCSGLSYGARALGLMGSAVAAPWLQNTGSIVMAHGLRCSTACGIFLDQGLNPCLLNWQEDSLPLSHQASPKVILNFKGKFVFLKTSEGLEWVFWKRCVTLHIQSYLLVFLMRSKNRVKFKLLRKIKLADLNKFLSQLSPYLHSDSLFPRHTEFLHSRFSFLRPLGPGSHQVQLKGQPLNLKAFLVSSAECESSFLHISQVLCYTSLRALLVLFLSYSIDVLLLLH